MRFISVITLTVILSALVYISPTRAAITITVTTTADISAVDGVCSLQEAITAANINASVNECLHDGSAGTDTIEFAIGAPGSTQTIALASGLPTITEAVILDGTTQSGATGCNQITTPLIILDGTLTIGGVSGFLVSAGGNNSEIRGFVIQNFDRDGIEILASNMLVQCNFIGTNALGTAAAANGRHGITITSAGSNNIIGTDGDGTNDDVEGNLISANINIGIDITSASLDNVVAGNIIGLDVTGTTTLGNRTHGVQVSGGSLNTRIGTNGDGTSDTLERNIISGNRNNGINLGTNSRNTTVAGNYIGTDINGTTTIGNGLHGVHGLNDSSSNIIGTNSDGAGDANEGNVISGNTADGIRFEVNVDDNVVAGNIIGLDLTGTVPLGNGRHGIAIASNNNRVGTDGNGISDISERNIISNNSTNGVVISANATGNTVAGNYIGTDITGTLDLGNGQNGVALGGGSNNNIIGTNGDGVGDASERNILSGNGQDGVGVFLGASNNTIAGNIMGLDVTGTLAIPNDRNGYFSNGNASSNIIGTNGDGVSDANERNIISGNGVHGVGIATGQDNVVAGNLIGTDITGTVALGNTQVGVVLNTTLNNRIGTNSDGLSDTLERNIISGNGIYGIRITGNGDANRISGNFVGTDINGTGVVSNATIGIFVDNGPDNTIIGSNADGVNDALEGNLVSGNGGRGIYIINIGTTSTLIAANIVGLDITQTVALGNSSGIYVSDVAGITIGGSNYQLGNVVAGNTTEGILVRAGTAGPIVISHNFIGTNVSFANLPNGTHGIDLNLNNPIPVQVDNNYIFNHSVTGLRVRNNSDLGGVGVSVNNCLINNTAGVNNQTGATITFEQNLWGAPDGPSGAGTGSGDSVSANVDFDPFVPTQLGACPSPTTTQAAIDIPVVTSIALFDPLITKLGFINNNSTIDWSISITSIEGIGRGVVITDTLPDGLNIISVTAPGGEISIDGQTVIVSYAIIDEKEIKLITITTTSTATPVNNTACVQASNQTIQECASSIAVAELPQTGENPLWRDVIMFILMSCGVGILWMGYQRFHLLTRRVSGY